MPGQKQKGKKNLRRTKFSTELIEPIEGQLIAVVETTHGGYPPRFGCRTTNDDLIIAPIQGSIAKGPRRVLVRKGDYVLLELLECVSGTEAYYIHHVYTKDDVANLNKKNYLDKNITKGDETKSQKVVFGEKVVEEAKVDNDINIDDI